MLGSKFGEVFDLVAHGLHLKRLFPRAASCLFVRAIPYHKRLIIFNHYCAVLLRKLIDNGVPEAWLQLLVQNLVVSLLHKGVTVRG